MTTVPVLSRATNTPSNAHASLEYTIADCSSVSSGYVPENILVDAPHDSTSRWNGHNHAGGTTRQWVLLKLKSPNAIVRSITFGKYSKPHPCNAKDVVVLMGTRRDQLVECLKVSLRNDPNYETFPIRSTTPDGLDIPTKYIQIVTLSAHNRAFNSSLWYVALRGTASDEAAVAKFRTHQEIMTTRLILKHLRQRGFSEAFTSLQKSTKTSLEHPLVTKLHHYLVDSPNWQEAEAVLDECLAANLFEARVRSEAPVPIWTRIHNASADGDVPSKRYGHEMVLDPIERCLYLYGGMNGAKVALSDLWKYSIATGRWTLLSADTSREGGPSPSDYHRMVLHPRTGILYLISNTGGAPASPPHADQRHLEMFAFPCRSPERGWERLFENIAVEGGPKYSTGYQMVLDFRTDAIFVFGGKLVEDTGVNSYSGMFYYNINAKKWTRIFHDPPNDPARHNIPPHILSRTGHVMMFDFRTRHVFILAGSRHDELLIDIHSYHCDNSIIADVIPEEGSPAPPPFAQATGAYDVRRRQIYIFTPYTKGAIRETHTLQMTLWIYSVDHHRWLQASQPRQKLAVGDDGLNTDGSKEWHPSARSANSLVYEENFSTFYLFGGHRNVEEDPLGDFWAMRMMWTSAEDIVRQLKFAIRRHRFIEMCEDTDPLEALTYLSTDVSEMVDHEDAEESDEYRLLMSHLMGRLEPESRSSGESREGSRRSEIRATSDSLSSTDRRTTRVQLFEKLLEYFPAEAKQPKANLMDMVLSA